MEVLKFDVTTYGFVKFFPAIGKPKLGTRLAYRVRRPPYCNRGGSTTSISTDPHPLMKSAPCLHQVRAALKCINAVDEPVNLPAEKAVQDRLKRAVENCGAAAFMLWMSCT
jgi:hypothetical protein